MLHQVSEFLWQNILCRLPKKNAPSCQVKNVQRIGSVDIPQKVEQVLGLGPKFSVAPKLDKTELIALVRGTASRAALVENDRVVAECVEALPARLTGIRRPHLSSVVESLPRDDLKFLQADKDGGFVVFYLLAYLAFLACEAPTDALNKLFFTRPIGGNANVKNQLEHETKQSGTFVKPEITIQDLTFTRG
ncbi:hypothetical protein HPB52_004120 [Rhipicephalus sanguineus]|uniref:Uncharacterized protein n=1 Tax=Rhipicephalus sanguineus TaxID=34632 RepID=A0A9D4SQ65_RHISA|nr:hypothetical protein HPB52_004120 [Rhipicephalus sanguineus]